MLTDPDLAGKCALITGSTRGIGLAFARLLLESGCSVAVNGRSEARVQAIVEDLRRSAADPERVYPLTADISTREGRTSLVDRALATMPRIDILMLNAAYDPTHVGSLASLPEEELDRTLEVNIKAQIELSGHFLPRMAGGGGGVVLLTGSAASQRGSNAFGVYAMSKAALSHLTMSLAAEYGRFDIRVNCIAPAVVRTEFSRDLWDDEERHRSLARGYPLQRIGEPEEIAAMALALCGKAGAWMTGQTLVIDGGQMAAVGCRLGASA